MNAQSADEIRRQLAFVTDPIKRLQETLKHGLIQDAEQQFREMIGNAPLVYFQHHDRNGYCSHVGKHASKDEFKVVACRTNGERFGGGFAFDHEGVRQLFGWTEQQRDDFMVEVMLRHITVVQPGQLEKQIAGWAGSWEINATIKAMERFVPQGHELRQRVEQWIVRASFLEGVYTWNGGWGEDWFERYFGAKINTHYRQQRDVWAENEHEHRKCSEVSEAVILRLRSLGMTDDEIRKDFYMWLEQHLWKYNYDLSTGVLTASIFKRGDKRRAKLLNQNREKMIESLMKGSAYAHPLTFGHFVDAGMTVDDPTAVGLYRKYTAKLLAEGKLGLASELSAMAGWRFFHTRQDHHQVIETNFDLETCAAEAFDRAWQAGEYGIAAALAFQFGEDACLKEDLLKDRAKQLAESEGDGQSAEVKLAELVEERRTQVSTVAGLARTTNKPIRLSHKTRWTPMA